MASTTPVPRVEAPAPSSRSSLRPGFVGAPKGLAWMALAQLFFAAMNVCTRLGTKTLPWSEIAATRFLIGALVAAGLASVRGSSLRVTDRPNTWRRSVYGTIAAVCAFYALGSDRISLGDAVTLTATAPIFVALLSRPLLGERVGRQVSVAIAIGFAGIVAVVQPSFSSAGSVAAIATLGAACYAVAMIWLRKIGPGESHEAVVFHFSVVATLTFLLGGMLTWRWPDWHNGSYLIGAGIAGGGAQIAMTRAYSLARAAPVTALAGLSIVFTYLMALPVFRDRPTPWQLAGSLLVILASVLLTVAQQPDDTPS